MSAADQYEPPRVWTWDTDGGGKFASINRPIAGATHEAALPVGEHPLQLYSMGTPNGQKVTILLEELLALGETGAEYNAHLVKILDGEQFSSGFVDANPNSKIPALVDHSESPPIRVFESGAILVYLAEKFGHFLPTARAQRTEVLNWLFWLQGSAPLLGGGFGHFYAYAPSKMEYPINRYAMEVKRHLDLLNKRLEAVSFVAGDEYSIADMAVWPWYGGLVHGAQYEAGEFLDVDSYTHLQAWATRLGERTAVRRGRLVNRTWGDEDTQLHERHSAADFDQINW